MMGRRMRLAGADEWDAVSKKARKLLCYLSKAGITKRIKQTMNRRERRDIKATLTDKKENYME